MPLLRKARRQRQEGEIHRRAQNDRLRREAAAKKRGHSVHWQSDPRNEPDRSIGILGIVDRLPEAKGRRLSCRLARSEW